jgi:hypothetical protein
MTTRTTAIESGRPGLRRYADRAFHEHGDGRTVLDGLDGEDGKPGVERAGPSCRSNRGLARARFRARDDDLERSAGVSLERSTAE